MLIISFTVATICSFILGMSAGVSTTLSQIERKPVRSDLVKKHLRKK